MNSTLNDSLIFAPQGNRSRVMKAMAQQLLQVMSNRSFFFSCSTGKYMLDFSNIHFHILIRS